jgi:nucleotide-binding universal stress UspA family protein
MIHPMHLHGMAMTVIAKDGYPQPMPWKCDTLNVAPGERWDVLVKCTNPGTWAFHCHILPHAESEQGMYGMVTALIIKPPPVVWPCPEELSISTSETLETGFLVDIVATRASAQASGIIIVGRGRQQLFAKLLSGETAIGVLRRTRTPVLAVASDAGWRPSVVVIATDFSPSATRAAELAVALAGEGATIHLVHVQSAFDRAAADQARETVYAAGARAMFEQLQHRLALSRGATVRTHLRCGDPAEMLLQVARDEHADLIATGTHSKGCVDRLTLGSVAEHVLRGAPCSVLVAPDPVA